MIELMTMIGGRDLDLRPGISLTLKFKIGVDVRV